MQYGININPRHPVGRPVDINALRGVKWARIVFSAAASRETISQAFNFYDHQINQYHSIGMKTLMVLNQETFWGHGPWQNGNWESYARNFANAIKPIVSRYRGKGVAYQIWNEGDIEGHSSIFAPAKDFAHVLDESYKAIKSVDPSAIVVLGGLASGAGDAVTYVRDIRGVLGGRLPVDAIGIHPYGQWTPNFSGQPTWGGWHGRLQDYMWHIDRGLPRGVPLWLTEVGISETVVFPPSQYPMVIKYMDGLNSFLRRSYGNRVPVTIWFAWSDHMRQAGIVDYYNRPKDAVYRKFMALVTSSDSVLPPTTPIADTPFGILLKPTVKLSVRAGAGTTFPRIGMIDQDEVAVALEHPKTLYDKLGKEGAWLQVKTPTGKAGYIAAWFTELGDITLKTTANGGLNIRAGAGTQFDRVGSITMEQPMVAIDGLLTVSEKIGVNGEWIKVKLPDGEEGYAAAWLIDQLNDAEAPPEAPDAPVVIPPPEEDTNDDDDAQPPIQEIVFVAPTVNLNLRSAPQVSNNRITVMKRGLCLILTDKEANDTTRIGESGWLHILMPNGTDGWTSAKFLQRIHEPDCAELDQFNLEEIGGGTTDDPDDKPVIEPPPVIPVFVKTISRLNVRSSPIVSNNLLFVLDADECVLVVADPQKGLETLGDSGWVKIRRHTSAEGWASAKFMKRIAIPDCEYLDKFDVSIDDDEDEDTTDNNGSVDPVGSHEIADGFDPPIGTDEERASDKVWPGYWFDPTGYGRRTYPAYIKNWGSYHTGADLNLNRPRWNADRGAPVYAIASGVVIFSGQRLPSWGNIIIIKHDPLADGTVVYSRYAHVASRMVKVDERVKRGTQIGTIGAHVNRAGTPYAGAEHLHFDICLTDVLENNPGDWPRMDLNRMDRDYANPKDFIAANRPRQR